MHAFETKMSTHSVGWIDISRQAHYHEFQDDTKVIDNMGKLK